MNSQFTNSQSILLNNSNKIRSRRGKRGVQKGVIHIQASFNNTIITVTDVRG